MADDPSSWRDIGVKKTTLGFVASIFMVGAAIAWQGSMVIGRISDLERSVQHFDTGLSSELNADLEEMQVEVDSIFEELRVGVGSNREKIVSLERLRASDLDRATPHWVVDALNDAVVDLSRRVEDLEDGS